MNYQQAYDKIIQAYFNNEIRPNDTSFCFCGTLCNKTSKWWGPAQLHSPSNGYTGADFVKMESALFSGFPEENRSGYSIWGISVDHPNYETYLFNGMVAALDVLREIHKSRGEDVDAITVPFTKRQLA